MNLGELRPAEGSNAKAWRRGRGHASGNGKTAGRGHKGQGARSGSGGKVGLKAARCLFTDGFLREVLPAEIPKKSLESICIF